MTQNPAPPGSSWWNTGALARSQVNHSCGMPCVKRSRSRRSISASMPKVEHILIWVRSPAGRPDGPGSVGLRPFRLSGAGPSGGAGVLVFLDARVVGGRAEELLVAGVVVDVALE